MSLLDKSIVSSPAWLLAAGIMVLHLVTPRPSALWLAATFDVVQAVAGVFLIAFPIVKARRARGQGSRS